MKVSRSGTINVKELLKTGVISTTLNEVSVKVKYSNNSQIFTLRMPYYHWFFHLGTQEEVIWNIHVPLFFAINMTLWKAYVPFSESCRGSRIAAYNEGASVSKIWLWCGHVIKETVYSKGNKARLLLQCLTNMLPHPVTLNASYEIMQSGRVCLLTDICTLRLESYFSPRPYLVHAWTVNV